ncbi:acetyltransferase (GNAT) family protein [Actinophytocola oryzae]|uniref:Acetyltransferase (GNAT) family protein n=2 Tax=Actinophytocola oryzae TaxID=502181 RepID=A0A4R7V0E3_9PSEU|nr:acetyltransferase (GNAT) family protein [Actinophytocola oryzae]
MRRAAASGRTTEQIGPFLATFATDSTNPYLNYAIPDDGATPSPSDVEGLTAAYRRRELLPRVEFLVDTAPAAETALLAAGWSVERRIPVMLCSPGSVVTPASAAGIELVVPESDDEIRGMIAVQNEAFGQSADVPDSEIAKTRDRLRDGGFAVLARDVATGAAAGGGVAEAVVDGTSEVGGIGVLPAYRRRGIASAMTAFLTTAVHDAGGRTVFLTPDGIPEQRLYARVGYEPAGAMVHLVR